MNKMALIVAVFGVCMGSLIWAAGYKDGKSALEKDYVVDMAKIQWGIKDKETDRLAGRARLFVAKERGGAPVTLTFDLFNAKAEKIDTLSVDFSLSEYGFVEGKDRCEGEFCIDFSRNTNANRMMLTDVKLSGEPVSYKTTFNLNANLIRSQFALPTPKKKK